MALTKEDLQAISGLLTPIYESLDKVHVSLGRVEVRLDQMDERLGRVAESLQAESRKGTEGCGRKAEKGQRAAGGKPARW